MTSKSEGSNSNGASTQGFIRHLPKKNREEKRKREEREERWGV
jgi:hypothetical protein